MTVALGGHCVTHPSNPASGTCPRCGAFTCADCVSSPFYKEHCPRCVARLTEKASRRAMTAIVFAGLSLGCYCLPLGFVAFALGHAEINAIDRGESPESGRTYAQAARILGGISGGLTIVVAVIVAMGAIVGQTR